QIFIESPIPNPTAMFRRDAIDQLGGYRDPEWPEDYDLYLRADQAGMKLAKTGGVYLRWREHDRRLTRTDVRYSRSRFQQAKAHYLAAGRLPERPFLIWGGGPSGAEMFDLLLDCGRAAEGFLDVHPRRIGGNKRGLPVYHVDEALGGHDHFILVAVGARNVRGEIRQFLEHGRRREGRDFLFVA
ncbi:MAG: glycosyl transferase, partial [Xanthomonadales bacterium]|nr:glycosyl transferase [Xanthomonadales bacterium]